MVKTMFTEDADILIVSYGAPSRSVVTAVKNARKDGLKAGFIKLETVWPFPEDMLRNAAKNAHKVLVVEMNLGQIFNEVQRVLRDHKVELLPKIGGEMHKPDEILEKIEQG
jgi:2-oxoglutarate ferredoxin oxidoreductase subunit alpha